MLSSSASEYLQAAKLASLVERQQCGLDTRLQKDVHVSSARTYMHTVVRARTMYAVWHRQHRFAYT